MDSKNFLQLQEEPQKKRDSIRTSARKSHKEPDWEEAADHGVNITNLFKQKSRTTSAEKQDEEGIPCQSKICKCCGYEVDRVPIDWLRADPIEDFAFLGAGYPLFYNFLIFCNILLGILFIGESTPDFIRYYQGNFCSLSDDQVNQKLEQMKEDGQEDQKSPCLQSFFNQSSLANILNEDAFFAAQIYYKSAVYFLLMITLYYFRHKQRLINTHVDHDIQSPADYSVIIKNIPKNLDVNYEEELKNRIQNYKVPENIQKELNSEHTKQLIVEKIVLVYEPEKIEEIEKEIDEKVHQKQEWLKNNLQNGKCQYQCKQVQEFDEEIKKLEKEGEVQIGEVIKTPQKYFAGAAIVSFSHESMKNAMIQGNKISNLKRILNHFRQGKSAKSEESVLYWEDRHLYVEQAPEANDIDWEFIHCSTSERLKARFICNILQIIIMLICFGSIWTLSFFQSKMVDAAVEAENNREEGADNKYLLAKCVSCFISVSLVLFNKFVLPIIVHQVVDKEKWSTKTKMNISFAIKLTLVLFCNTALITLAVEILTFENYYGTGGMIGTESMVFILNAVVPPLAWLINPWYIQRKNERDEEEKLHKEERSVLTQKQANELHENTVYLSGKRYSDIMKTMWFTFLYSPVIPLGSIFSSFGLIFYYWVDKYNIVHKFTAKENISIHLTMQMIDLLDLIIIIHAIGDLFFKWQLYGTIDSPDVWFLCFSAAYNILMIFDIQIFKVEEIDEVNLYKEDYDRENPYLKKKAVEHFIKSRKLATNQFDNQVKDKNTLVASNQFLSDAQSKLNESNEKDKNINSDQPQSSKR